MSTRAPLRHRKLPCSSSSFSPSLLLVDLAARGRLLRNDEVGVLGSERTAAYPNGVIRWLDDRLARIVIEGQLGEAQPEGDQFGLARLKSDALKALQTANWLREAGAQVADIALHNLCCRARTRVTYSGGGSDE